MVAWPTTCVCGAGGAPDGPGGPGGPSAFHEIGVSFWRHADESDTTRSWPVAVIWHAWITPADEVSVPVAYATPDAIANTAAAATTTRKVLLFIGFPLLEWCRPM